MSETIQPILKLQHRLNITISNLYYMAFSVGLQWEWQELKSEIKGRGWLPLDMAHLKVIEHPAVPGIIQMIEILEEAREKLPENDTASNIEGTSSLDDGPVQEGWLSEDYSEEENMDMWQQNLFVDLLSVFEACWYLENGSHPSIPVYDQFDKMYFNAKLQIYSDTDIVAMVIAALNSLLRVNWKSVYVEKEMNLVKEKYIL
ncbi:hypothetical protein [Desertivirga arenae]|uniref:hypothetical protein n=1 Tax=Desertivirga arenae TaxID=2810309 RepID=UPI001A975D6A|nr:hypothetical protein [Pedobacter sp. SYSU D00823]